MDRACVKWVLSLLIGLAAMRAFAAELGPGDVLKIAVYGNPDLSVEAKIGDAGSISYPLLGELPLAGLSPRGAETRIASLLSRGGFVRNPQVTVLAMQMQSQQVAVLGMVNKPGRYPIDGKRSVADMLAMAGGVSAEGGDTVTLIRAGSGEAGRKNIDLSRMAGSADPAHNPELSSGDILYVERAPKFYIYGEVARPGAYRLERNMTVLQALSAGGGLTPRGTERGMRIKRRDGEGRMQEVPADHGDMVRNEDVVYIRESLF